MHHYLKFSTINEVRVMGTIEMVSELINPHIKVSTCWVIAHFKQKSPTIPAYATKRQLSHFSLSPIVVQEGFLHGNPLA